MTVKVYTRWKTAEDFNRLRGTKIWTKVKFFWRKGWVEIPAIMGSGFLSLTGAVLVTYSLWYGRTHDMTPKYFKSTRIYRPTDPEAKTIRRVSVFDK